MGRSGIFIRMYGFIVTEKRSYWDGNILEFYSVKSEQLGLVNEATESRIGYDQLCIYAMNGMNVSKGVYYSKSTELKGDKVAEIGPGNIPVYAVMHDFKEDRPLTEQEVSDVEKAKKILYQFYGDITEPKWMTVYLSV